MTIERNARVSRVGIVTSDKMDKTIVVSIERVVQHASYGKGVKETIKFKEDNEKDQFENGDNQQEQNNDKEIYNKIIKGHYDFPEKKFKNVSDDAKDLIKKMICPQNERLSAEQVLAHPWFNNVVNTPDQKLDIDINTFKSYVGSNKLKKVVLTYVADRLNEDDILNLLDATSFSQIAMVESALTYARMFARNDKELSKIEGAIMIIIFITFNCYNNNSKNTGKYS